MSGDQESLTECQGRGKLELPVQQQVLPESETQSSELKVSEYMMSHLELVQRLKASAQNFFGVDYVFFSFLFSTNGNKLHLTLRYLS